MRLPPSMPPSTAETHDRGGDIAAYVLGALEPEEARDLEQHLDRCPACQAELASLQGAADLLPLATPPAPVPTNLKRNVMAEVNREAKALRQARTGEEAAARARVRSGRSGLFSGRPLGAFAGAGALALAAIVAIVIAVSGGSGSGTRVVDAKVTLAGATAQVRLTSGQADLTVSHMPQPPSGKIYQVWLQRGSEAPTPTNALFGVAHNGSASVAVPGSLHGVSAVLVTPEPAGGSQAPTHAPVIEAHI